MQDKEVLENVMNSVSENVEYVRSMSEEIVSKYIKTIDKIP